MQMYLHWLESNLCRNIKHGDKLNGVKKLNRKVETVHYNGSLHVWRVVNK